MFLAHMSQLFIINIGFTKKVNTICGGGQVLVSGSKSLISRVPGLRVIWPRVPSPGSHVARVSGLGSNIPGPISGPDFRQYSFPVEIANFFKTASFIEHLQWLLVLFGTSFLISSDWKMSVFRVRLARIFPAFGLNTEIYFVNLGIQSKCKKLRTRKIVVKAEGTNFGNNIKRQQRNMTQL